MRSFFKYLSVMAGLLLLVPSSAGAKVYASDYEYELDGTVLVGYLAYDDEFSGKRPGVLVVHEWTGLGEYVKSRCEQLARLGYVAFGADIYGKGVRPETHEEAAKVSGFYAKDRPLMRARVKAGLDELKKSPLVDPSKTAAIGYCFGGAAVLELARSGADVGAVVTFHGVLANPNPKDAGNIRAKVLVNHGADDPVVDIKQVEAFIEEMRATDADWRMIIYGGAVHSFTVPTAGASYDESADRRSWDAMVELFDEVFK